MKIIPLTGTLGAEIIDADLRCEDTFEKIAQAFKMYSVIVIREQTITPDEQLEFARRFGNINVNRFFPALETHPEVAVVLKEPDQTRAIGEEWHTDHSYDLEPAAGSILYAVEMPAFGGDTVFCSMGAAYEALSDRFKEVLCGLSAWHSSRHVFGESAMESDRFSNAELAMQDALHPMVIKHPLSGRHGLYVNPDFTTHIDGLAEVESKAILNMLYAHCSQPEFQCRVRWQTGDVTIWDNRATWHKAINDYDGERRYMHRVTMEGCALTPARCQG